MFASWCSKSRFSSFLFCLLSSSFLLSSLPLSPFIEESAWNVPHHFFLDTSLLLSHLFIIKRCSPKTLWLRQHYLFHWALVSLSRPGLETCCWNEGPRGWRHPTGMYICRVVPKAPCCVEGPSWWDHAPPGRGLHCECRWALPGYHGCDHQGPFGEELVLFCQQHPAQPGEGNRDFHSRLVPCSLEAHFFLSFFLSFFFPWRLISLRQDAQQTDWSPAGVWGGRAVGRRILNPEELEATAELRPLLVIRGKSSRLKTQG